MIIETEDVYFDSIRLFGLQREIPQDLSIIWVKSALEYAAIIIHIAIFMFHI